MTTFGTVGIIEMSKSAALRQRNESAPNSENETVTIAGSEKGTRGEHRRGYLTEAEVETFCAAARARGRWGHRDATMIPTVLKAVTFEIVADRRF